MPSLQASDGCKIAWEEAGGRAPLLCHPGGPGASGSYFGGLPELAVERTVLLLDPRGTGASDRPADPGAYELSDYAADVEAVRAHLGIERLDVLGHSDGGFVAMAWASAHPERVRRLVLSNTAARFTDAIRQARQAIIDSYAAEPWYTDALAAHEAHRAARYADDAELAALLEREIPFYFPHWREEEQAIATPQQEQADYQSLREFVETDVDDVMKLFRVFNDATHGDAGVFDLNALHALKQRVEGAIRFLSEIVRPAT